MLSSLINSSLHLFIDPFLDPAIHSFNKYMFPGTLSPEDTAVSKADSSFCLGVRSRIQRSIVIPDLRACVSFIKIHEDILLISLIN